MLSARKSPAVQPFDGAFANGKTLPQLEKLAWREREVATIVYRHGASTANEVQARLSGPISNGAVRSMLVRLVGKGILMRRWGKRGRGQEYVYLPVITPAEVKHRALVEVSEKYFEGSLSAVALGVLELIDGQLSNARYPDVQSSARLSDRP
jgi:predicted transcriptional regulator